MLHVQQWLIAVCMGACLGLWQLCISIKLTEQRLTK
jgi:hypothetical protein